VRRALTEHYPESLRQSRRGGKVVVWLFVDETGAVVRARLQRSSGDSALDRAALQVADSMRFVPALNGDRPVGVWLAVPIAFTVR